MGESSIFNLRQPCKNRGLEFIDNKDGSATIDGKRFERNRDAEDYLAEIPRKDFNQ